MKLQAFKDLLEKIDEAAADSEDGEEECKVVYFALFMTPKDQDTNEYQSVKLGTITRDIATELGADLDEHINAENAHLMHLIEFANGTLRSDVSDAAARVSLQEMFEDYWGG